MHDFCFNLLGVLKIKHSPHPLSVARGLGKGWQ